ncbi:hypothetical protein DPMN_156919 [Dreissena polymorpha]|uniref:Uncharacterized protein n=1 Tax=Dreissena polymorpha TaxID=45954 RepID=A0A9D4FRJ1_DREPO|nr:hypothetical protein DPMN_156919 [Dreissena polymorpha]
MVKNRTLTPPVLQVTGGVGVPEAGHPVEVALLDGTEFHKFLSHNVLYSLHHCVAPERI